MRDGLSGSAKLDLKKRGPGLILLACVREAEKRPRKTSGPNTWNLVTVTRFRKGVSAGVTGLRTGGVMSLDPKRHHRSDEAEGDSRHRLEGAM